MKVINPVARMHARWWTALPAIPASRNHIGYRRLRRQFADHTMNTWVAQADGSIKPGGRGFYLEGREDHLVTAFFEDFSLFPNMSWLSRILNALIIKTRGEVIKAAWSYSYEEVISGERRPRIADLIIMWRDELGDAVLVIEAKKPGYNFGSFSEKDIPGKGYYLQYAAMANMSRKYQALLIDEADRNRIPNEIATSSAVLTWQLLSKVLGDSIADIGVSNPAMEAVLQRIEAHHVLLGVGKGSSVVDATGSSDRYEYFQSLPVASPVIDWLIGSELFFASRIDQDRVSLPYAWLAEELSASDFKSKKQQTTAERGLAIWRLQ